MPAILDDPDTPTMYRTSGSPPYPSAASPSLPDDVHMYQVTLRDRQTVATIVPFASHEHVPRPLLAYLSDQLNKEIEGGDTYPMTEPMSLDKFARYWFQNFGAVMLLGSIEDLGRDDPARDWARTCLGSFYIKPNYPGRSSHVCNAGFLVTDQSRNRGVGRLMGEAYLEWAPRLGYTYSVFNLVYETNVASCRIWDALGFKRIGRVKGCGDLKSYPGRYIDALIYGRDLVGPDAEELQSEDRFDKIRFYLKYGKYPPGADRAEKSRLRAAATHYRLVEGDTLMHGDKEVVADPRRQLEIARRVHGENHAGINRTTTTIRERYHWRSIKDTATEAIKNCEKCLRSRRAAGTVGVVGLSSASSSTAAAAAAAASNGVSGGSAPGSVKTGGSLSPLEIEKERERERERGRGEREAEKGSVDSSPPSSEADPLDHDALLDDPYGASMPMAQDSLASNLVADSMVVTAHSLSHNHDPHGTMQTSLPHDAMDHHHHHPDSILQMQDHHHHHHSVYQPIDPQLMADGNANSHEHEHEHNPFDLSSHSHHHHHHHHGHEPDFQSLLNDPDDDDDDDGGVNDAGEVDREMAMFVRQHDDDMTEEVVERGVANVATITAATTRATSVSTGGVNAAAIIRTRDEDGDQSMGEVGSLAAVRDATMRDSLVADVPPEPGERTSNKAEDNNGAAKDDLFEFVKDTG